MPRPAAPKLTRRTLFRTALGTTLAAPILGAGGLAYAREIEADWIEITRHDVPIPHLPRVFDGFTLTQISDLHCDEAALNIDLAAACELASAQNSDVLVVTGDFSSYVTPEKTPRKLLPLLQKLRAREGVFGVMGNHDYWGEKPEILRATFQKSPLRELRNELHIFERDGQKLYLGGHDDFLYTYPPLSKLSDQIPPGSAAILLGHEPDLLNDVSDLEKYALFLAGHSHGGQICWPTGRPVKLPYGAQTYSRGWYQRKNTRLYVNRGLGTVGFPMRFAARPEISVFTLRAPVSGVENS